MKIGLVLEGGASKGVFTAGLLDYWMKKDVEFPYIVSVSAGTCNAFNFLSRQIERTKHYMIPQKPEDRYFGIRRWMKTGHLCDLDMVFEDDPKSQYAFDAESYFHSGVENEIVITNCKTGKAEYVSEREDTKTLFALGKASCSLPFFSDMVHVNNSFYLDGGLADSIPVKRAFQQGCDKIIVVLTHNSGYVPSMSRRASMWYSRKFKEYPELVRTISNRPNMYQKEMKLLQKYEQEGKALVFQPKETAVKRMESDLKKMEAFYQHGYGQGKMSFEELKKFMKEDR